MPKTRKRSRSVVNTADSGDVENVLLRLLPTEVRTASVNSFQPTAFHSCSIFAGSCSSISRSHSPGGGGRYSPIWAM